jgi:antitoxin (DNA-binding transcriptional repressor) of toxin-antitoxin stability system
MRVAGVREFRNRAPELVKGDELVFVTRHGKLSGILVPLSEPQELPVELRRELLIRLAPG